MKRIRVFNGVA